MDDLSIHDVVGIRTDTSDATPQSLPFYWRTIRVIKKDGTEFGITLFGKKENLEILEIK